MVGDRENSTWDFPVSAFLEWLSHVDLPLVAEFSMRSGDRACVDLRCGAFDAGGRWRHLRQDGFQVL
jgi:hypothetical protein